MCHRSFHQMVNRLCLFQKGVERLRFIDRILKPEAFSG